MALGNFYQTAQIERDRLSKEIEMLEFRVEDFMRAIDERKGTLKILIELMEKIPSEHRSAESVNIQDHFNITLKRGPRGLIKRLVLDVLESHPSGLNANSILDKINSKSSKPYLRSSLSPQLSRLKDDGYITLEGKIWRLKKIEPLDANPSKESSKGSDITLAKDREAGSGGGP